MFKVKSLSKIAVLSFSLIFSLGCKKEEVKLTPVLTTLSVSDITEIIDNTGATAISGGNITNDNGLPITARGVCWSNMKNPTLLDSKTVNGTGTGLFNSKLTSLKSNTTYYVRAYATNSAGTEYGDEVNFKTSSLPSLTTVAISNTTYNSVTTGGNIIDDGGFQISAQGVCWSKNLNPTIDLPTKTNESITVGQFSSSITGLEPATTYYVRAYATNSIGTVYGNEISFMTLGVVDIDGNVYQTITFGSQTWMVENLRTTKYRNGDLIGTTNPSTLDITSEIGPKYQWAYNGDESKVAIYGRLYTWYAATDSRNIAPKGWHIPSYDEFELLETYLINNGYNTPNLYGYVDYLGKALSSTTLWQNNTTRGNVGFDLTKNNSSGFNALPVGKRNTNGTFDYFSYSTLFWGSDERDKNNGWGRQLCSDYPDFWNAYIPKEFGCAIRCVQDKPLNMNQLEKVNSTTTTLRKGSFVR